MKNKLLLLLFAFTLCLSLAACTATPAETKPAETTKSAAPEVTPESTPESTPEATPEETPEATPEATPGESIPDTEPGVTTAIIPETTPEETEPNGKEDILRIMEELYNSSSSAPAFRGITYIGELENGYAAIIYHDPLTSWGIVGLPRKIGDHIFSDYEQLARIFMYDGETIKELSVAYENGLISNEELADIYAFWENTEN